MGLRERAGGSVWFGQAAISPPKAGRAGCAGVCSSSLSPELPWEPWPGWFLQRAAQDSLNEGKSTPLIRGRVPRQSGERWIPPAARSEALLGTEHSPSTGLLRAPELQPRPVLLWGLLEEMLLCALDTGTGASSLTRQEIWESLWPWFLGICCFWWPKSSLFQQLLWA